MAYIRIGKWFSRNSLIIKRIISIALLLTLISLFILLVGCGKDTGVNSIQQSPPSLSAATKTW
jgi:hypothetical protein